MVVSLMFIFLGLTAGAIEVFLIHSILNGKNVIRKVTWLEAWEAIVRAFDRKTPIDRLTARNTLIILLTAAAYWVMHQRYYFPADKISACLILSYMTIVVFTVTPTRKFFRPMFAAGLVIAAMCALISIKSGFSIYMDRTWWNPLLGGAIGFGILFVISLISAFLRHAENVSLGDMTFLAVIGIMLGWRLTLETMIFAFAIAAITGIMFRIFKVTRKAQLVVFAPSAAVAVLIVLLFGENLFRLYSGTFN